MAHADSEGLKITSGLVEVGSEGKLTSVVSKEVFDNSISRTAKFIDAWKRAKGLNGFSITDEIRHDLGEVEYAGDRLAWALTLDPGDEVVDVIRGTKSRKTDEVIEVRRPVTLIDSHVTLFEDGVMGFWTPNRNGNGATDLIQVDSSSASAEELTDFLYILPLNSAGLPRMLRPTSLLVSGGLLNAAKVEIDAAPRKRPGEDGYL